MYKLEITIPERVGQTSFGLRVCERTLWSTVVIEKLKVVQLIRMFFVLGGIW